MHAPCFPENLCATGISATSATGVHRGMDREAREGWNCEAEETRGKGRDPVRDDQRLAELSAGRSPRLSTERTVFGGTSPTTVT